MGRKLPDYVDPLAKTVVMHNGPEAIDLAQQAAESYYKADHGYDAMMSSEGRKAKSWVRDGWEKTVREEFSKHRTDLIKCLKDDNPQVRGRRFEGLYEMRADEMIGEVLKEKYKTPAGHAYRPEYDYKPANMAQGQSK